MAITKNAVMDAVAYLEEAVVRPAFFDRLAAHGIRVNSETEALGLLKLGAVLCNRAKYVAPVGQPNPYESIDSFIKNAGDDEVLNDVGSRAAAAIILQALIE